jgi:hypothetical protein
MLREAAAAEISADISELLAAVETYLVRPPREREWPAAIAVPATKEKLKRLSQLFSHAPSRSNLLSFYIFTSVP